MLTLYKELHWKNRNVMSLTFSVSCGTRKRFICDSVTREKKGEKHCYLATRWLPVGSSGLAVWGVGLDRLDAEIVGSNPV